MSNNNNTTTNNNHQHRGRSGGRVGRAIAFAAGITAAVGSGIVFSAIGADAALEPDESTFVPIEPCRLFDTRVGIGGRATPLGPGESFRQQVTGANGDCVIPADASAIAMNATAIGATVGSFATFSPAGSPRPLSSNLNYFPNQPPTPNKVDVKLSGDGAVDIYNAFGQVDLLADVMGYYRDSGLSELEADVADTRASLPVAYQASSEVDEGLAVGEQTVLTLTGDAPRAGSLVVDYSAVGYQNEAGRDIECGLTTGSSIEDPFHEQFESGGADGGVGTLAGSRLFDVEAGGFAVNLVCRSNFAGGTLDHHNMTALFVAD